MSRAWPAVTEPLAANAAGTRHGAVAASGEWHRSQDWHRWALGASCVSCDAAAPVGADPRASAGDADPWQGIAWPLDPSGAVAMAADATAGIEPAMVTSAQPRTGMSAIINSTIQARRIRRL